MHLNELAQPKIRPKRLLSHLNKHTLMQNCFTPSALIILTNLNLIAWANTDYTFKTLFTLYVSPIDIFQNVNVAY